MVVWGAGAAAHGQASACRGRRGAHKPCTSCTPADHWLIDELLGNQVMQPGHAGRCPPAPAPTPTPAPPPTLTLHPPSPCQMGRADALEHQLKEARAQAAAADARAQVTEEGLRHQVRRRHATGSCVCLPVPLHEAGCPTEHVVFLFTARARCGARASAAPSKNSPRKQCRQLQAHSPGKGRAHNQPCGVQQHG